MMTDTVCTKLLADWGGSWGHESGVVMTFMFWGF